MSAAVLDVKPFVLLFFGLLFGELPSNSAAYRDMGGKAKPLSSSELLMGKFLQMGCLELFLTTFLTFLTCIFFPRPIDLFFPSIKANAVQFLRSHPPAYRRLYRG